MAAGDRPPTPTSTTSTPTRTRSTRTAAATRRSASLAGRRSGCADRCTPRTCRCSARSSSARSAASATVTTAPRTTTSRCVSPSGHAPSSTSPRCSTTGGSCRAPRPATPRPSPTPGTPAAARCRTSSTGSGYPGPWASDSGPGPTPSPADSTRTSGSASSSRPGRPRRGLGRSAALRGRSGALRFSARTGRENLEIVVVYDADTPRRRPRRARRRSAATDAAARALRQAVQLQREVQPRRGELARATSWCCSTTTCEVISDGCLVHLVAPLDEPGVGMTGAKLYFADSTIQHAGLTLLDGSTYHPCLRRGRPVRRPARSAALMVNRECSGLTAACAALRREVFDEVGGLCEALPINFNDVDLSYKLRHLGYRLVWVANASLPLRVPDPGSGGAQVGVRSHREALGAAGRRPVPARSLTEADGQEPQVRPEQAPPALSQPVRVRCCARRPAPTPGA